MIVLYLHYLIPIVFLILLSIIDFKTFNLKDGVIPSALTTSFIGLSFILNPNPTNAIFTLILGLILVDLDFFGGLPDLKVMIACGIVLPNIFVISLFGCSITFFGIIYKLLAKKSKRWKEVPFIPIITIAYLSILGILFLI